MLFSANPNEQIVMDRIQQLLPNDYALVRLSPTMLNKSIIDASALLRYLLDDFGIVDYDSIVSGNKVLESGIFITESDAFTLKCSFYKANTRGDKRFWIYGLNSLVKDGIIQFGDLIYITVACVDGINRIIFVNLSHSQPDTDILSQIVGIDEIAAAKEELLEKIKNTVVGIQIPNSNGNGKAYPRDVGDTLEHHLGLSMNNFKGADYKGLIELKAKSGESLTTLFTLRPEFENTPIAKIEPNDRSRVAAFQLEYGYISPKKPNDKSLYITIGNQPNQQGFYLEVDEKKERVNLLQLDPLLNVPIVTAYFTFEKLREALYMKHPSTLWLKANKIYDATQDIVYFDYYAAEFTRTPKFASFIDLIQKGIITYDWRGSTSMVTGKNRNHGNPWRISPENIELLFNDYEIINF
ncbi:MvaI/BcnI family restriction endonuclease [Lactococcus lactis]